MDDNNLEIWQRDSAFAFYKHAEPAYCAIRICVDKV